MQDAIQKVLDELTTQYDGRTDVFDLQIENIADGNLHLRGKLLDQSQLSAVKEALSRHAPDLSLDTASVRFLNDELHERFHVVTNLSGLYDKPTVHLPFSSELCYGTEVEVLEEAGKWSFAKQKDGYLGWVYSSHLAHGPAAQATHLVLAPSCELRAEPDSQSDILTRVVIGTGVQVQEIRGEWAYVTANKTGWMPSRHLRAIAEVPNSTEERRKTLLADYTCLIGVPYLWGGTSGNGIDCSGLSRLLHQLVGLDIPRDADMQHAAAKPVEPPFEVGDLLFFAENSSNRRITHVGVSLGGWIMVHSSLANNGAYVDDVQQRKSLIDHFVSAGSFLR